MGRMLNAYVGTIMKVEDIKVGGIYHDGKAAVREVLAIGANAAGIEQVEYRVLAAKVTQQYSYMEQRMVSVIGTTTTCHLASFAAWAKTGHSKTDCDDLMTRLAARRVKLSPGELAFMESVLDEIGNDLTPGTMLSYDHTEGRAVGGLAKKDLVVRHKGEVEVTKLGAAWLRNAAQARIAG